jgi:hypothetical protein
VEIEVLAVCGEGGITVRAVGDPHGGVQVLRSAEDLAAFDLVPERIFGQPTAEVGAGAGRPERDGVAP